MVDDFVYLPENFLMEKVSFENIPDQYTKSDDITVFFTIFDDAIIDPESDKIGLKQVGLTKAEDCLIYASVDVARATSIGNSRNGTAKFLRSTLPTQDDEFYQFCYILKSKQILGSSIPFQINFSADRNDPTSPNGEDRYDVDRMLFLDKLKQENRQSADLKRRLEIENEELRGQLELKMSNDEEVVQLKEEIDKLISEKSRLIVELETLQATENRLQEENAEIRRISDEYKTESGVNVERCSTLEKDAAELNKQLETVRNQYEQTSRFIQEQATTIVELQRRLVEVEEQDTMMKRQQTLIEQELRDFQLTSEKTRRSLEGRFESQAEEILAARRSATELEEANKKLEEEVRNLMETKEEIESFYHREMELSQELKNQIKYLTEKHQNEQEHDRQQLVKLEEKLEQTVKDSRRHIVVELESTKALQTTVTQLKERCLKHQKNEMEAKRQIAAYQTMVQELRNEIEQLTARLYDGSEKYKEIHNKYVELQKAGRPPASIRKPDRVDRIEEQKPIAPVDPLSVLLREPDNDPQAARRTPPDEDMNACPVCGKEFPKKSTSDERNQHVNDHFG